MFDDGGGTSNLAIPSLRPVRQAKMGSVDSGQPHDNGMLLCPSHTVLAFPYRLGSAVRLLSTSVCE